MYIPQDHEFFPVDGLAMLGIFQDIMSIHHAFNGDGLVWMLGQLRTRDTATGLTAFINFKTPYPADIEPRWRLADFVSWMVSHEMMEAIKLRGEPLFNSERLIGDHSTAMVDESVYRGRLSKVRERYHRDCGDRRWDGPVLRDALGLSLNPAWR